MAYSNYDKPTIFERLICAATYLTGGVVGVVWLVICFLAKIGLKPIVQYHIIQSIIFYLLLYILSLFFSIVTNILGAIPFVGQFFMNIVMFLQTPIYYSFSIINGLISALVIYMTIGALLGLYSYVPLLSDMINARRR